MASRVSTREIEAVRMLMRQIDKPTKAALRKESQAWAPTLERAIRARAHTPVDRQIAATARTTVTARGLKATIGASGRLASGEPISEVTRPYEFGTGRPDLKETFKGKSPRGQRYHGRRRLQKQIPRKATAGRFIYQGLADATPDLVDRYVRALVRVIEDA